MKKNIKLLFVLCIMILLTACNTTGEGSIKNSDLKISGEKNDTIINNGSADEAINVVYKYFEAQKTNDYDTFISVLTEETKKGFTRENNSDFGVISLSITDIYFESESHLEDYML